MIIKDAIVPFHPKDISTLTMCCESLKNILNVERIILISSVNPNINGTEFINEKDISEIISLPQLTQIWNDKNPNLAYRSGWIYQQLIELAVPQIITDVSDDYIVCDSDIVFLRNPYNEVSNNVFPFNNAFTGEYHPPYRCTYERLMKEPAKSGISFINHHLVTNKNYLAELKLFIESRNGKRWDIALIESLDYFEASTFASDDLYGDWMFAYHPDKMVQIPMKILDIFHVPSSHDLTHLTERGFHIVSSQQYKRG